MRNHNGESPRRLRRLTDAIRPPDTGWCLSTFKNWRSLIATGFGSSIFVDLVGVAVDLGPCPGHRLLIILRVDGSSDRDGRSMYEETTP